MSAYIGRGIVSLDSSDLGLVPDLSLSIATVQHVRHSASAAVPVPLITHAAVMPTRVSVSMTMSDYTAENLRHLTGGGGAGGVVELLELLDGEYELGFVGENCETGEAMAFTAYRFMPLPSSDLGMVGLGYHSAQLSGLLLPDLAITTPGLSQYGKFQVG